MESLINIQMQIGGWKT